MKILFISQYFYPEQFSNNAIAEYLSNKDYQVDVLTCVPNYGRAGYYKGYSNRERRFEVWRGIRIFRARTIARGETKLRLILNYLLFPISAIFEYHVRRVSRPDLTFVSMPSPLTQALSAIYLKKRFGIPTVFWVQDIWPESPILTLGIKNKFTRKVLIKLCDWIYRQADVLLVQSEGFVDRMRESGVHPDRIGVFPNTAPKSYVPLANTEVPGGAGRAFQLMFAGNIGESQDFETILGAADRLRYRNIHWNIVGSGRHEKWLRDAVKRLDLSDKFTFEGRHPEDEMPKFFARADAMLVSLRDRPIFRLTVPYKVQCYMACGRPIIGSISGETARILRQSGAGFVVEAGRPDDLADAIARMARLTRAERESMGDAGRKFFDLNYDSQRVYESLEEWFEFANRNQSLNK